MNDCPNCEYHRQRTQIWREEAYKQAGHPLPEPLPEMIRNDALEEVAKEIEKMTAFGKDTTGSFAVYIRGMKHD